MDCGMYVSDMWVCVFMRVTERERGVNVKRIVGRSCVGRHDDQIAMMRAERVRERERE